MAELTGVPANTLRSWERRYGVPEPRRTDAGHRQYDDDDVAQVRRLVALMEAGLSPSEAADQVARAEPAAPPPVDRDPYHLLCERILAAIDAFDPDRLEAEVRRALLLGSSVDVYEKVMVPVCYAVGERWEDSGEAMAREHLTTEVLRSVAQDLYRLSQPARPVGRAILGCFADELHVLPLYGIAFRLAQRGFRSFVLGARTTPAVLAAANRRLQPDLVALSVTVAPARPGALVAEYAAACAGRPWIVGGGAAGALREAVEADGGRVVGPAELEAVLSGLRPAR